MEVLILFFIGMFYLITSYSAGFFGFIIFITSKSIIQRIGISFFFAMLTVEYMIFICFFDYIHWISYLIGSLLAGLYFPLYFDGTEFTGKRSSRWFRRLRIWRLLHVWNDFRSIESIPDQNGPALFAVHPHGFLPISVLLGFAFVGHGGPIIDDHTGKDPMIAVTKILFWIPFIRDLSLWAGCVSAEMETMVNVLENRSLIVAPGGIQEGIFHDHNKLRLSFCHWGFLEVAKKAKVPVIPVFAQGENRIWIVMPGFIRMRQIIGSWIKYAFPMIFIPFLFPHELRMRTIKNIKDAIGYEDNLGRENDETRKKFKTIMIGLIKEYEDPEDIDLKY